MNILILNGPNLNLLGTREPGVYGFDTLDNLKATLRDAFSSVAFAFFQSNHEGALVDRLHQAHHDGVDGVVFNPGAFGHTSIGLRDAIAGIEPPVVEVHITNVYARESFRQQLVLSAVCKGVITGLGLRGYHLAVRYLVEEHRPEG